MLAIVPKPLKIYAMDTLCWNTKYLGLTLCGNTRSRSHINPNRAVWLWELASPPLWRETFPWFWCLKRYFFHFHSCPRPGLLRTGCQCLKREKSLGEQEPLGWGWGLSGPCGGCPRGAGRCRGAASRSCSLPKEPLPQKVPVCSDGDRSYSCTMIYHILWIRSSTRKIVVDNSIKKEK